MNTAISDSRHPTANKLLYIAWAIEIIAALVSLLIGVFLIFGDTELTTQEILVGGGLVSGLLFILLSVNVSYYLCTVLLSFFHYNLQENLG